MSEVTIKQLYEEIIKNRSEIKGAIEDCERKLILKVNEEKNRIDKIEKENILLRQEIEALKLTCKKNNIIIFGIEHQPGVVSFENLSGKLKEILGIDISEPEVNDFYTLGNLENSPIKIEFTTYLKKNIILQNSYKLKGSNISISHDLSEKQRADQKLLRRHLNVARKDNKNKCYIRNNVLHINENRYTVEELLELEDKEGAIDILSENCPVTPGSDANLKLCNRGGTTGEEADGVVAVAKLPNRIADRTRKRAVK